MTPIKNESLTNIIRKEIHHRQSIKNVRDTSSTLKNAKDNSGDEYTRLLNRKINKMKKKKRKIAGKIQDSNENSCPINEDKNFKYNIPIKNTIKTIKRKKSKRQAFCDLSKDNLKNDNVVLSKISKANNVSLNALTDTKTNMQYTSLLKKQLKKKKKKKEEKISMIVEQSQMQQKYKRIPCPSKDIVIKLVEMLQREIRHSIRQIELLTGQPVSIGSGRWSAKKVCTTNLVDIKTQEDLWAAYVRGFNDGYRVARAKSHSNNQNGKQHTEVESNQTLAENSDSPQAHQKSSHTKMTRQKVQLNSSEICEEVTTNLSSNQTTPGDLSEFMVLEPDVKAYFDAQMTNECHSVFYKNALSTEAAIALPSELEEKEGEATTSSMQSTMSEESFENEIPAMFEFGTHMLCEGEGKDTALSEQFACSVCESTFDNNFDLTLHYGEHSGETPLTCEECDKTYLHSRTLIKHFRKHHHLVELPYACDVCSKRFLRPESLASHYVIHTGERPYECYHCEKSYATSGTLARHMTLVHDGVRS